MPRRSPFAALAALLVVACGPACPTPPTAVVMMIGDGMGPSQITLARDFVFGPGGGRFAFEELPALGLMTTYSASGAVTDSGAAATAMATGVKTDNRYVGLDSAGSRLRSIAELARAQGWRYGLATTTTVFHATPAAYFAHLDDRYDYDRVAAQAVEARPDLLLGGGLGTFLPKGEGSRRDDRNLVAEAEAAGITIWKHGDPLGKRPVPLPLFGLFARSHLTYEIDRRRDDPDRRDPSLADLARLAVDALSADGRPFFLMIEGGRIDHGAHGFDPVSVALEVQAFDAAVQVVRAFQATHPATLLVLTADHATGGLAINDDVDWELLHRWTASVAWLTRQVRDAGGDATLVAQHTGIELGEEALAAVRAEPDLYVAERVLGTYLAQRHRVTWIPSANEKDTKGHTGEDVPLWAAGPGEERFRGVLDNTDVPKRIVEILGWDPAALGAGG